MSDNIFISVIFMLLAICPKLLIEIDIIKIIVALKQKDSRKKR